MFYECLDNLCKQNNETVSSVVKSLGLSTSKVTAWKNGSYPNGIILTKLADYLDCSVDYLLGRVGKNSDNLTIEDSYEQELIEKFRSLSEQGQEYIMETLDMAVLRYKKGDSYELSEKKAN